MPNEMRKCHLCGSTQLIERHHVFSGPYRKASERHGMTVDLCHFCHNEPGGVHFNKDKNRQLKREFQRRFEATHSRAEFRRIFGKSYILEDEE